jgi:hypothetical protein
MARALAIFGDLLALVVLILLFVDPSRPLAIVFGLLALAIAFMAASRVLKRRGVK